MSYHSNADLGGHDGYGPVIPEAEAQLFHAAWEPRVLAITLAMGATGLWNIDMSRAARETLADYSTLSYYQIWLAGLEKLLLQSGAVQPDEIAQYRPQSSATGATTATAAAAAVPRVLRAADVPTTLARSFPTVRQATSPARYAVGQYVLTRATAPAHHTRLPGYARGKRGVVERVLGAHVFADAHAQGLGEQPRWLYTVAFDEQELWGADSRRQGSAVSVDAWEPYLEPA